MPRTILVDRHATGINQRHLRALAILLFALPGLVACGGGGPTAVPLSSPSAAPSVAVVESTAPAPSTAASTPPSPSTGNLPADGVATLITLPDAGYQPFYDLIASATTSVEMVMYALVDPKADAALIAAAGRGVAVKVLLDSDPTAGGGPATNQDAFDDLAANGVDVRWAWTGTLWHQKSILVDGEVAAIMSANLVAADYAVVRDYAVVTRNPATVAGMAATFAADFAKTTVAPTPGEVPEGSDLVWSPGAEASLVDLIGSARAGTTMYVETEQLDSAPLEQALIAAVKRGVTVNLTMTSDPSYTAALDTLKAGGVHVSLYAPTAPIYIHAKAMSVNDDTVFVGSTNLTTAMTDQNRNVGIITTEPTVVGGILATLAADFAGATPY